MRKGNWLFDKKRPPGGLVLVAITPFCTRPEPEMYVLFTEHETSVEFRTLIIYHCTQFAANKTFIIINVNVKYLLMYTQTTN